MPRQAKTPLFDEFNNLPNGFGPHTTKSDNKWQSILDESKPLNLELGCGKAEMSIALAKQFPDQNFVGVDLKADRLVKAARFAAKEKITNIIFIQDNILHLEEYFAQQSVDQVWITFPDPFPKDRQIKHRMLNRNFLDIYKELLKPEGLIHLKTDNNMLFNWVHEFLSEQKDIELIKVVSDLHESDLPPETKYITTFEQRYIDIKTPIKYLQFRFLR